MNQGCIRLVIPLAVALPAMAQPSEPGPSAELSPQEVTITATKRSERLLDVPLAVTVAKGRALDEAGIKDLQNLQFQLPGVQFGESVSDRGFRLRGIGLLTGPYISGQELPVGVVVDGVVQGIGAGLSNLADVDRIEVMRGPQGTQFGKNAAAGLIHVVTARPRLGESSAALSASYGTGSEYELRGTVNAPLAASAALRMTAFAKGHGDWIENLAVNRDVAGDRQSGVRARLLFKPSSAFEAVVSVDASRQRIAMNSQQWTVVRSSVPQPGIRYGIDNRKSFETAPGARRLEHGGVSLEAQLALGGGYMLSSLTAVRRSEEADHGGFGLGYGAVPFPPFVIPGSTWLSDARWDRRQTTQELRVSSPQGGSLEWIAGYLYYRQPTTAETSAGIATPVGWLANIINGASRVDTRTTSHALFADGKWRWSERTALLVGARYTSDDVRASYANLPFDGGALGAGFAFRPVQATPSSTATMSAHKLTGKLGIEHRVARDTLLYASVATGYLGPIVNYGWTTGVADRVRPQTNVSKMLGVKSALMDRRIGLALTLFDDDYDDAQTGYFSPAPAIQFRAENAARLYSRGLEAEASARLTPRLSVAGSLTYLDAKFRSFCSGGAATSAGAGTVPTCVTELGFPGQQLAGYALPSVPRLTAALRVDYGIPVFDRHLLEISGQLYHRSKTRESAPDALTEQPAYDLVNVNATLTPERGAWQATIYVRNLLDKHFTSSIGLSTFAPPGTYVAWTNRESLRTIGASVRWRF